MTRPLPPHSSGTARAAGFGTEAHPPPHAPTESMGTRVATGDSLALPKPRFLEQQPILGDLVGGGLVLSDHRIRANKLKQGESAVADVMGQVASYSAKDLGALKGHIATLQTTQKGLQTQAREDVTWHWFSETFNIGGYHDANLQHESLARQLEGALQILGPLEALAKASENKLARVVESHESALALSAAELRRMTENHDALQRSLMQKEERLTTEIPRLERAASEAQARAVSLQADLESATSRESLTSSELAPLRARLKESETANGSLKDEIVAARSELNQAKEQHRQLSEEQTRTHGLVTDQQRREMALLETRITEQTTSIAALERAKEALAASERQNRKALEALTSAHEQLTQEHGALRRTLSTLNDDLSKAESRVALLQAKVETQTAHLDALLKLPTPTELQLGEIETLRMTLEDQSGTIEQLKAAKQKLGDVAADKRRALDKLKAELVEAGGWTLAHSLAEIAQIRGETPEGQRNWAREHSDEFRHFLAESQGDFSHLGGDERSELIQTIEAAQAMGRELREAATDKAPFDELLKSASALLTGIGASTLSDIERFEAQLEGARTAPRAAQEEDPEDALERAENEAYQAHLEASSRRAAGLLRSLPTGEELNKLQVELQIEQLLEATPQDPEIWAKDIQRALADLAAKTETPDWDDDSPETNASLDRFGELSQQALQKAEELKLTHPDSPGLNAMIESAKAPLTEEI